MMASHEASFLETAVSCAWPTRRLASKANARTSRSEFDLLLNRPDVVRDVPEQRLHGGPDHRQIVMLKPAADLHQGPHRVSQAQQVASQQI